MTLTMGKEKNHPGIAILLLMLTFPLFFAFRLLAQDNSISFKHISLEEGLSHNNIHCIFQDNRGFLWFGTDDGLNRYDGYEFKIFLYDKTNSRSISDNRIRCIVEDSNGDLWIGTLGGGLNKYDKETEDFTVYRFYSDSLRSSSHNKINSICMENKNLIWLGTENGLIKFNPESEEYSIYKNDPDNPQSLSSNNIYGILKDSMGYLWISTYSKGLNRFNKNNETFTVFKNEPSDPGSISGNCITSIYEDRIGNLWISTLENGLNRYNRGTEKFIVYKNDPGNPKSINSNRIKTIYETRDGDLWIGSITEGLIRYDPETENYSLFSHDPDNPNSISHNSILSLFEDKSGVFWIGTYAGGINKLYDEKKRFEVLRNIPGNLNSLSNSTVFSVYEDADDILWIGTVSGLNKYDPQNRIYKSFINNPDDLQSISHNIVRSIYEDKNGTMWIGTDNGLNRFNKESEEFTVYRHDPENSNSLPDNVIRAIIKSRSGQFWICTHHGVSLYDSRTESFTNYINDPEDPETLSYNMIRTIYEDKSGVIWIGTYNGLNRFNPETKKFKVYREKLRNYIGLTNKNIYSILEDSKGIFWLGTKAGLNIFNRETGEFRQFTTEDGLRNNIIYCIQEDNSGDLWLSTDDGLSRAHKVYSENDSLVSSDRINLEFRNYDLDEGVQGNEFNSGAFFKGKRGELYFGGMNGLNIIEPDKIKKDNKHIPPVLITEFSLFSKVVLVGEREESGFFIEKSITETDEIILSHNERYVSFKFAALDYTNPEKNEYAYMMEGLSREWKLLGKNREVNFDLTPGKYNLKIKGSNNDRVWNEEGAGLKIIVKHPYWATLWFRLLGISVIGVLILTVYRIRTHNIKKENIQLERHNTQLNEQMLERERAEREINRLRNYLSNIINSMPSILVGVDRDGRITQWNIEAEKLTGIKAENALGKMLNEILPYLELEMEKVKKAIVTTKPQEESKVALEIGGELRFSNVTVYPLMANGAEGAVIRIDDITERVKIEEMMIQSEKMMSIGGLAAGMAHEINNPLAGIIQNSQVLQNRISDKLERNIETARECGFSIEALIKYMDRRGIKEMIDAISDSGNRAARIVENMLSFSRRTRSAKQQFNIANLIERTVSLASNDYDLKQRYDFKQIKIITEFSERMPDVYCEGSKIQQVILNLLKNSSQALKKNQIKTPDPKIILRTYFDKEKAYIEVEDNGPGMTEVVRKRIFEPFFTTKDVGEGTGLGLSVSYFIIKENHNGEISVATSPNGGTKFTICLPMESET